MNPPKTTTMPETKHDRFIKDLNKYLVKPSTADPKSKEHTELLIKFALNAIKKPNVPAIIKDGALKGAQYLGDQYLQGRINNMYQPLVSNAVVTGLTDGIRQSLGLTPKYANSDWTTKAINAGVPTGVMKAIYNGAVSMGVAAISQMNPGETKNAKEAMSTYGASTRLSEMLHATWNSNATTWNEKGNLLQQILEYKNPGDPTHVAEKPDGKKAEIKNAAEGKPQKEEKINEKEPVKPVNDMKNNL